MLAGEHNLPLIALVERELTALAFFPWEELARSGATRPEERAIGVENATRSVCIHQMRYCKLPNFLWRHGGCVA